MTRKFLLFKNFLIFIHIFFAVLGLIIYQINYKISEDLVIQKTINKQTIIGKAGSLAIENLLHSIENQLSSFIFSFTKTSENASFDKDATRAEFASFIKESLLPITGVALYDENGKMLVIENREHIKIGENQDFSDYDFIKWSKDPINKGKVFISDPYIARSGSVIGKSIMVLVEPVYFGNRYKGTLSIRLLLDSFRDAFIKPLVSEDEETSLIIDNKGLVISGTNTNFSDKNYSEFVDRLSKMIKGSKVPNTWVFQSSDVSQKTLLVSISKIDIPNSDKDLYTVMVASKDQATASLTWLRRYGYVWLGFGVLTTVAGGVFVVFLK